MKLGFLLDSDVRFPSCKHQGPGQHHVNEIDDKSEVPKCLDWLSCVRENPDSLLLWQVMNW